MKIILLGAPGAGKGTQAKIISEKLEIPHISTGDIFRANIKGNTPLGMKVKEYLDNGELVPDELTVEIVKDRLGNDDCAKGYILDGFPRTIPQAEYLDKVLSEMNTSIDLALLIDVKDEDIITRMSGRRVCTNCGATYNIVFNPTKVEGICDSCNSEVIQRADDSAETVLNRLETYHKQTQPLIDYYKKTNKLVVAEGAEEVKDTTERVLKALGI
ncbi:adenylate kinase [Ruminiclostridium herbifermentans]|uniref:Adenylate kinase n=1 Tax=Ruminiclostridium herbifermentans TaxID=2488810 RepID=A0A4U7JHK6_9FIRM|nr:adenylate kinase [Ruminiclostridium herbifermentans]QNU67624.1 adenylate kinase [Ruminiclostridium herbifermentans]